MLHFDAATRRLIWSVFCYALVVFVLMGGAAVGVGAAVTGTGFQRSLPLLYPVGWVCVFGGLIGIVQVLLASYSADDHPPSVFNAGHEPPPLPPRLPNLFR
jgi:hypothetical protein